MSPQPSTPPARSETLDAVRALALIGVLLVNMLTISGLRFLGPESLAALQDPVDRAVEVVIRVFVEGKALAAFSLLFGLSFALLMNGAARRGEPFGPFFARRLVVLAAFGLLNAVAFFWGDILITYAALGALLPLAARLSQPALLRLALVLLVLPALGLAAAEFPPPGLPEADQTASLAAFAAPGLGATLEHNWLLYSGAVGEGSALRAWRYTMIGGLFLLGLHVGRSGLPDAIERGTAPGVWPALVVLGACVLAEILVVAGAVDGPVATALLPARPLMGIAYVFLLARLLARPAAGAPRAALAPLGRMALTGYLTGGLLGQAVFYGWGLGRIGEVGSAGVLAWSLAIAALLGGFAHLWLRRYPFGPWEWLWRWLSRRGWSAPRLS